ncbi:MAG: cadherin domain-containing protein, partial [Deltaproteobacteria bacterium]|nr:cadherin domain-containing protein [Deltaproteobacteria bacterium]
TVSDNTNLDYETSTSYSLTVQVEDPEGLTDTATVTVNVTGVNEAPSISDSVYSIDENTANGTVVGKVSATDPDTSDTLIYSIIAGNDNKAFSINASTGEITVNNSAALDFETTPSFTLTIRVTDNGSPSLSETASVTINLNDIAELVDTGTEPTSETTTVEEPAETPDSDTGKDQTDVDTADNTQPETDPPPTDDLTAEEGDENSGTEDTAEDTDQAGSDNSLAEVPNVVEIQQEEASTSKAERQGKGTAPGGRAKGNEQQSEKSTGSNTAAKQSPLLNALSANEGAVRLTQKGADRMSAQARKMISNRHLQNQLDALKDQIAKEARKQSSEVKFMVGTAGGVTASIVAGYSLWVLRGVSLVASAMASLPVWGFFDPMPVLSRWEKTPQDPQQTEPESTDEDEKKLKKIFETNTAHTEKKGIR